MDYIVIEGVPPYDGRYEFDLGVAELTTREWGWIRRYSGYMPLTTEEGFRGADPELFASFALVALVRAGKVSRDDTAEVMDRLLDTPPSARRFESDTAEENDASPPPPSSGGNTTSSGDDSTASSVSSTGPPNGAGTPGSASSVLAPARSGT